MTPTGGLHLLLAVEVALAMVAVGILLAVVRLVKGPSLPDRVVAVDLIANLAVAVLGLLAVRFDEPALLQPAMVLALVAFLGTVAFAHYIERRASG
jgi:multicomponent Na+:H+ antiporter subunit F